MLENRSNVAQASGRVLTAPVLSHTVYAEDFYTFTLGVMRLSGTEDRLPVTVSGRTLAVFPVKEGDLLLARGQLRSYNKIVEGASRLDVQVFARQLASAPGPEHINEMELEGYICKKPVYRITPFGREIADMLVAVNRSYNKSDYIPVIAWGRNAQYAGMLEVGRKIRLQGRMQSREYEKHYPDGSAEVRTTYEVSVTTLEVPEEENL